MRWAAAEGVTEDVIAAVLLLHERSVEEIVPQLSPLELEKVIELVVVMLRKHGSGVASCFPPRAVETASVLA